MVELETRGWPPIAASRAMSEDTARSRQNSFTGTSVALKMLLLDLASKQKAGRGASQRVFETPLKHNMKGASEAQTKNLGDRSVFKPKQVNEPKNPDRRINLVVSDTTLSGADNRKDRPTLAPRNEVRLNAYRGDVNALSVVVEMGRGRTADICLAGLEKRDHRKLSQLLHDLWKESGGRCLKVKNRSGQHKNSKVEKGFWRGMNAQAVNRF